MNETERPAIGGAIHRKRPRNERRDARRSVRAVIAEGADSYDRSRHLARLLPLGPAEIADDSDAARREVLAKLSRALRAERSRGRAGHWTYDLNRHLALSQAYVAERRLAAHAARSAAASNEDAGPKAGG
jgi:hypothetical protein